MKDDRPRYEFTDYGRHMFAAFVWLNLGAIGGTLLETGAKPTTPCAVLTVVGLFMALTNTRAAFGFGLGPLTKEKKTKPD